MLTDDWQLKMQPQISHHCSYSTPMKLPFVLVLNATDDFSGLIQEVADSGVDVHKALCGSSIHVMFFQWLTPNV